MSLRTVAAFPEHLRGPVQVPDQVRYGVQWRGVGWSEFCYREQTCEVLSWKTINPFRELVEANVRVMLKRRLARNGVPFHVDDTTENLKALNRLVRITPLPLP